MSTSSAGCIPGPRCCCGSSDCAFLAHNGRLLEGLERDVSKAAQLGQALLVRHEAYVADSERERRQMMATIQRLENEKLELEAKNAQTIKENRNLLDQLEQLNESICGSDAQIQALQDTLRSTEEEIQRLSSLAARTQLLEAQLFDLEREQSRLQHNLETRTIDERTAIQRWQKAERTLGDLQDQIDRIEREAREERERHVEVVARMERRMAVEGELGSAAARLKAKAGQEKGGSTVVSHFVKDILLDNANLQHGILELREMLVNSNEEVERLRDQLRLHQPISPNPSQEIPRSTLDKELDMEAEVIEPVGGQELHIHHHYHGSKPTKSLPKMTAQRKHNKKKRFSLTSGHFDPAPSLKRNSTATILSQTSVTVPNTNRWSQATTLGPGSLPNSPVSDSHRGSMYDRVFSDATYDSSRPTSPPDSIDMQSPMFGPTKSNEFSFDPDSAPRQHRRSRSRSLKPPIILSTVRSTSSPIAMTTKSAAHAVISAVSSPAGSYTNDTFAFSPTPSLHPEPQAAIPEENEDASALISEDFTVTSPDEPEIDIDDDLLSPIKHTRPTLRRHASHESLISISGMDIHTLQSRPAQLLMSNRSHFSTSRGAGSVGPELTPWTATAHGSLSQGRADSYDSRSFLYSTIGKQKPGPRKSENAPEGKSSGGWFFGKWGATPTSTSTTPVASPSLRPTSSDSRQTESSQDTAKATASEPTVVRKKASVKPKLRPSGVNQNGPIWGFFDSIPETPTNIVVVDYDAEALGEALNDRSPPRTTNDA
ncbi:hypothetical protein OPT61_g7515 [Boeremia exigua]|uniref:Uncharacterized protein n=1 Tax=Boeremia exigua TaxID=749465 RepID=A0ACC2I2X8_9PLEO|nr:hypothetical protein OPT61_g7515 [Boeremia exigua]